MDPGTVWPRRLLTVAIIAPHLTLGTALGDLHAEATTGFVRISVAKQLPENLVSKVGGRMQLLSQFPGLLLIVQELHVEECIFRWRRVDRQPAELINMGLGLP